MLLEYPTKEEWNTIAQLFPPKQLSINIEDFNIDVKGDNFDAFIRHFTTLPWVLLLTRKLNETYRSFIISMYFFKKGIPDDEWFIINENGSITYYPHFNDHMHRIKSQFDYYSDNFYHKYFSALDIIGHILNEMLKLNLKISAVTFDKALKGAKSVKPILCELIEKEKSKKEFKVARQCRDNFTHKFSPCDIGPGYIKKNNCISFGGGDYTTSKEIINNQLAMLEIMEEILKIIRRFNVEE